MENKVLIKQFKNKAKKPVAGLTPEHAIYDKNGVRLDAKLGNVNLQEFRDAQTEGVHAVREAAKQYDHQTVINNSTITNAADEEDITVRDNVLSLKDRNYIEGVSEMGYVILRKNKSFAEQVIKENTIYEIRYAFTLSKNITIPNNCVLKFEGGSISGAYTITGSNTCIQAKLLKIFDTNVTFAGTWNISEVYPEWFGAKGDGVTDDTLAIKKTILNFSSRHYVIKILKSFRITDTLISNTDTTDITCIIKGVRNKYSVYRTTEYDGGFKLDKGVNLFVGIAFSHSVFENLVISVEDIQQAENLDNSGSIFKNCTFSKSIIESCSITGVGSVFYNTQVTTLSKIKNNCFLFIHNFAHCDRTNVTWYFVDSVLEENYIDGASGATSSEDNDCFEWGQWQGSTVINNFIDYYRCIYNPTQNIQGNVDLNINSIGNHYEVFRYLYNPYSNNGDWINIHISSIQDSFSHTIESNTRIQTMPTFKYTKGSQEYSYPNSIVWIGGYRKEISFINTKLTQNIGNVLCISEGINFGPDSCSIKGIMTENIQIKDIPRIFIEGTYISRQNYVREVDFDFYTVFEQLPDVANFLYGEKVRVGDIIYKKILIPHREEAFWKRLNNPSIIEYSDSTAQRNLMSLTSNDAGLCWFDKSLGKPVWWTGTVWVDATGTQV